MSDLTGDAVSTDLEVLQLHLRSILASVPDGMIVIDENGKILAFSSAAEKLFSYKAEEVIGGDVSLLMGGHDEVNHQTYVNNYLETGKRHIIGVGRVVSAKRSDGTIFPVDLKIGEAKVGDHYLFTAFVRDLSEQRRNELRMQEMQAELVHFSRMSAVGTMASALAHELNQPLTAITQTADAAMYLMDNRPDRIEDVHGLLTEIDQQAHQAGDIVRALRGFIRKEGNIATSFGIRELLEQARRLVLSEARQHSVEVLIQPGAEVMVKAVRVQIAQVVVNLLRNAIEAIAEADPAERRVMVSALLQGDVLRVDVLDTGPGIAEGVELFTQFETTKTSGMGLGLSISRSLIESNGGRIWCDSTASGARFSFTVPLEG